MDWKNSYKFEPGTLYSDLRDLLNAHSAEGKSDTPDYLLAKYLLKCLDAYNETVSERDAWLGLKK